MIFSLFYFQIVVLTNVSFSLLTEAEARPYSCGTCRNKYKSKKSLYHHMKYLCKKDPQFECFKCHFKFKQKGHLNRHLLYIHNIS